MYICIYVSMYVYIYTYIYIYVYMYLCMYIIYIHIHIYIYVFIYLFIYLFIYRDYSSIGKILPNHTETTGPAPHAAALHHQHWLWSDALVQRRRAVPQISEYATVHISGSLNLVYLYMVYIVYIYVVYGIYGLWYDICIYLFNDMVYMAQKWRCI